ncbi:MAG: histidinol-phosphate transaminase [Chloroflexi bacterium]|nr:histidinol-phosphate transaminase [Chloroflexota bacterium]
MDKRPPVVQLVRPHFHDLEPYVGVDPPEVLAERVGIPPERLIKLDGNENVYGCSPMVQEALAKYRSYNIYPDPLQRQTRRALAAYAGTDPDQIVAGAGCDELIDLVARLFLGPEDKAIDLPPTFGMYRFCTRVQGAAVVAVPRDEQFAVDVAAVRKVIDRHTKMVFVTNPNNPTGNLTPEEDIRALLETGLVVVVDETYHEFSGFTVAHLVPEWENLVVLRTFSKWPGLAGMRVGYGIMAPLLTRYLLAMKMPYNVSVAAELALAATLEDADSLLQRVRAIVEERERMLGLLRRLPGVTVYPSKGNFLLCRFPARWAQAIHQGLMRRGIFVRYFDQARLQDCLRISVGKPEHTDAVVSAIAELLQELT